MKFFYALLLSLSMTIAHAQTKSTAITQNVKQAIEKQIPEAKQWSMQITPMGNQFFQVKVAQGEYHPKPTMFIVMRGETEQDFMILGTVLFRTAIGESRCHFPSTIDKTCKIIYDDGSLYGTTSYQNNRRHGLQTTYENNYISTQTMYENGLKHGVSIMYIGEPPRTTEHRTNYQYGKRLSTAITTDNGSTVVQNRDGNGKTDNLSLAHYNNGLPSIIMGLSSNTQDITTDGLLPNTRNYSFYANGQLANSVIYSTEEFKNFNIPPLEINNWYPNGQMAIQIRYNKAGKLLEESYWDEHGNTLATKPDMQPFMDQSHEMDMKEKQP